MKKELFVRKNLLGVLLATFVVAGLLVAMIFTANTNTAFAADKMTVSVSVVQGKGTVVGTGEYDVGTSVTLTAKPEFGYAVYGWVINGNGSDYMYKDSVTVTVSSDAGANSHSIYSQEKKATYTFNNGGNASCIQNQTQTVCNGFEIKPVVIVPDEGYTFSWETKDLAPSYISSYGVTANVDLDNDIVTISGTWTGGIINGTTYALNISDLVRTTKESGHTVRVTNTDESNVTVTGSTKQTVDGAAIAPIVIEPKTGYNFASTVADDLNSGALSDSGLSATLANGAITISGTPTKCVRIDAVSDIATTAPQIGTRGISSPSGTTYNYVYLGKMSITDPDGGSTSTDVPIKWRVLDAYKANDGTTSGMFLLSEYLVGTGVQFNSNEQNNTYQGSNAQAWCLAFANNTSYFSTAEQAAMMGVVKTEEKQTVHGTDVGVNSLTTDDKMFLLSAPELAKYVTDYMGNSGVYASTYTGSSASWWLRSPQRDNSSWYECLAYNSENPIAAQNPNQSNAIRPAFNLDWSSVLFTSAAVDGKVATGSDLSAITTKDTTEFKLTLKDTSRAFNVTQTAVTAEVGTTVQLGYTGATVGTNDYISVFLVDSNGNTSHYGRVAKPTTASGTVDITIPEGLEKGNYTLRVFNEQCNGDYETDYSSAFCDVALTAQASEAKIGEVDYETLEAALSAANDGDIIQIVSKTVTPVENATLKAGVSIYTYAYVDNDANVSKNKALSDSKISVSKRGDITFTSGKVQIVQGEVNMSGGVVAIGKSGVEITNLVENDTNLVNVSVDADTSKDSVAISGTVKVQIGETAYENTATTYGKDTAYINVTTSSNTLTSGMVKFGNGASVIVNGKTITAPADDYVTVKINKDGTATVTVLTSGKTVTIDGNGYTTTEDNTTLVIDGSGNVTLTAGAIMLGKDEYITVGSNTITDAYDGNITVKANVNEEGNSDGTANVTVSASGGKIKIGEEYGAEYTTAEADTTLVIDGSGNVTLTAGAIKLASEQSVIVGETTITEDWQSSFGATKVAVKDGKGTITVQPSGDIKLANASYTPDKVYTSHAELGMKLVIDESGNVQITDGAVYLDNGESIIGGRGKAITNNRGNTITVSVWSTFDEISLKSDGDVKVGGSVVTSAEKIYVVDDGNLLLSYGEYTVNAEDEDVSVQIGNNKDETSYVAPVMVVPCSNSGTITVTKLANGGKVCVAKKNDAFTVGEGTYVASFDGEIFVIGGDSSAVSIGKGSPIGDGEYITGASGKEIKNPENSGNDFIGVEKDSGNNKDIVTVVTKGGTVVIDDVTYTTAADGTKFEVTSTSVTLTSGAITLGNGEKILIGTTTITNGNGEGTTIEVGITDDGNGTITLDNTKTVDIGGKTYTSAADDTTLVFDGSSNVTLESGSVKLGAGATITVGTTTITATTETIVGFDGENITLSDGKCKVTTTEETTVKVTYGTEGNKKTASVTIPVDKEYTIDATTAVGSVSGLNNGDRVIIDGVTYLCYTVAGSSFPLDITNGKLTNGSDVAQIAKNTAASITIGDTGLVVSVTDENCGTTTIKNAAVDHKVTVGMYAFASEGSAQKGTFTLKIGDVIKKFTAGSSSDDFYDYNASFTIYSSSTDYGFKCGDVMLTDGSVSLKDGDSIFTGNNYKKITNPENSGNDEIIVAKGGNVTVPEKGIVTIGIKTVSTKDDTTYTATTDDGAEFVVDNTAWLTKGGVILQNAEEIVYVKGSCAAKVQLGNATDASVVNVPDTNSNTISVKKSKNGGLVTVTETGNKFTVGDNTTEHVAAFDGEQFVISKDGNVVSIGSGDGADTVVLEDTETEDDKVTGGSGKEISNPKNSKADMIVVKKNTPSAGTDTVTVLTSGGTVVIDDTTYKASSKGATFKVESDGKVTLTAGGVMLDDGNTTIGGVSGKTIENVAESEGTEGDEIDVSMSGNVDEIIVKANKTVKIDGKTYVAGTDGVTLTVDADGNVTVKDGSVIIENGGKVVAKDTTIENTGDKTIEVDKDGKITAPTSGSTVKIGGDDGTEYTTASDNTTITTDGGNKLTGGKVELDNNESINVGITPVINGSGEGKTIEVEVTGDKGTVTVDVNEIVKVGDDEKKYTSDADNTKLNINSDGTVEITDGRVSVEKFESIKVGGMTVTNDTDSGATIQVDVTDGKNTVIVSTSGGKVSIGEDAAGTEYTTAEDDTEIEVTDSGNKVIKGKVILDDEEEVKVVKGDKEVVIKNKDAGDGTITVGSDGVITSTGDGNVEVGGKQYGVGNGTTISTDGDGKVTIKEGTVKVPDGGSVTGGSGKEITNPEDSGDDKVTVTKGDNGDTVTIPTTGGKVVIGGDNGTQYEASEDNVIIIVTGDGNKLDRGSVKLDNGEDVKVGNKTIENDGDGTITVSSDGTVISTDDGKVKIDGKTYTTKDGTEIKVGDDGNVLTDGTVTIGDEDDNTIKAGGKEIGGIGTTVTVGTDGGKTTTTVSVPKGGTTTITTTIDDDTTVTTTIIGEDDDTTVTIGEDGITLTEGTATIDGNKDVTVGDNTYTTGDDGATITSDGKVIKGSVKLDDGEDVEVGGKTIENTGDSDKTITVKANEDENGKPDGTATITIPEQGGKVTIGGEPDGTQYEADEDDTVIKATDEGNEIIKGSVKLDDGEDVKVGGKTIKNDDDKTITVKANEDENGKPDGTATITIPEQGGKVTIGGEPDGTQYEADEDDTVIKATDEGNEIIKGSVKLDTDESIKVGDKTIENTGKNGKSKTITVKANEDENGEPDGTATITIPEQGGEVTIGGDDDGTTYTSASDDTVITTGKDGKVTLTDGTVSVPGDKEIKAGGSTYTTGKDGATIDSDGKLIDGSVTFDNGSEVKVGDKTIKNDGDGKIFVDSDGNVIVPKGGKVIIGDKEYVAAGDDGMKLKIDSDGNVKVIDGATTGTDGKTQIAGGGSVTGGTGNAIENSGDANDPITVVNKNNKDYITVPVGGKVKIGGKEYEAGDEETIYVIDEGSSVPNVIVSGTDSSIDSSLELVVTKQEKVPEKIQSNVKRDEVTSSIYDVTLLDSNKVSVQPNGKLTIRLLIPEDVNGRTFRIVHLHGEEVTNVEYTIDGDYAVFTVDKLSEFSFVVDNSGSAWWLILIFAIIVAAEIVFIVLKTRKDKKDKKNTACLAAVAFGGAIPVYEIVLLVLFGVVAVALGAYIAYILIKGKKASVVVAGNAATASSAVSVDNAVKASVEAVATEDTQKATVITKQLDMQKNLYEEGLDGLSTRFNYSFTAKLILSSDEAKANFAETANYLLSYKKVKSRMSWKNLSFNSGRIQVAKLAMRGRTLWIYLALDPKEFIETKYGGEDFSDSVRYEKVPYAIKIKSDRGLKHAKELIDLLMSRLGIERGEEVNTYVASDYPYDSQQNLIERELIKVHTEQTNAADALAKANFSVRERVRA